MMKFMVLFLSFISNFFSIDNKCIAVNEVITEKREIIDEKNDFKLFVSEEKNNTIYRIEKNYNIDNSNNINNLEDEENIFVYEVKCDKLDFEVINNKLIITIIENNLLKVNIIDVTDLDKPKEIVKDELIIDKIDDDIFLKMHNNKLILFGTVTKYINKDSNINIDTDIFVYELYNINTDQLNLNKDIIMIGGEKEEKLTGVICYKNNIYLSIEKELISEKPFGNGSRFVLSMLNEKYEILNNKYINDDNSSNEFIKLEITDNFLYYVKKDSILLFDHDLNYLHTKVIEPFKSLYTSKNDFIIVFGELNNYLLDSFTDEIIGEISEDYCKYKIKCFDDHLYAYSNELTCVYFDIVDLRYLNIHNKCYQEYENLDNVNSLFGKCNPISREYTTYFEKNCFGHYEGQQEFVTISDIAFTIEFTYDIYPKVNLIEGMTYPNGYNILFNGDGVLDGEYIYNNTPCYGEGNHTFILEGRDRKYEVNFKILNNQKEFLDFYVEDGINVKPLKEYSIKLKLSNYENYRIKELILDEYFEKYKFENGELEITFEPFEETGSLIIYFKEIIFEIYGKEYIYNIGKVYIVNAIEEQIDNNSIFLDEEYIININDSQNISRAIEVEYINESVNESIYYPISTQEIILKDINNTGSTENIYKVIIYLVCNNNSGKYEKVKLLESICEINSESNSLGNIVINNYENTLKQMKFEFDKENVVYKVNNNSSVLYEYIPSNNNEISIIIISFISSIIIGIVINKIIIKKRNKKIIKKYEFK